VRTVEYKRKHRWASYGTSKCKEYLRYDFLCECAYCKLNEVDCGLVTSHFFEVDHFIPQTSDTTVDHSYGNLIYSCQVCNNKKGNENGALNPCEENIWGKHITNGFCEESGYICKALTEEGSLHLKVLQLNTRAHIKMRKQSVSRLLWDRIDEIVIDIQNRLKLKKSIDDEIKTELFHVLELIKSGRQYEPREPISIAVDYLNSHSIINDLIFKEYNLDISITFNDIVYYCELVIDASDIKSENLNKYIDTERLKYWSKHVSERVGILFFYPNAKRMYFFPIPESSIDVSKTKYHVHLTEKQLLNSSFTLN